MGSLNRMLETLRQYYDDLTSISFKKVQPDETTSNILEAQFIPDGATLLLCGDVYSEESRRPKKRRLSIVVAVDDCNSIKK
jgi:hypothetical protein